MNLPTRIFGIDAEEAYQKYLKENKKGKGKPASPPASPSQPSVPAPIITSSTDSFYHIEKSRLMRATTLAYRKFLKDAQYGDIDNCTELRIAKGILKYNQSVRDLA